MWNRKCIAKIFKKKSARKKKWSENVKLTVLKTGWSGALSPSNFGYLSKVLFKIGLLRERGRERETQTSSSGEQF